MYTTSIFRRKIFSIFVGRIIYSTTVERSTELPQRKHMRPITSGIGSAPHRLAKILAKPLSKCLGTISNTHLRNSNDLIIWIEDLNVEIIPLSSFEVKSLLTNVPYSDALQSIQFVIKNLDSSQLPPPKKIYLKLVEMCRNFGGLMFDSQVYYQHSGLAMGSLLSPVAACLYIELLEKHHYLKIVGSDITWFRYVDVILVIVPKTTHLNRTLVIINQINSKIQFTVEMENNRKLPFRDTEVLRSIQSILKIY